MRWLSAGEFMRGFVTTIVVCICILALVAPTGALRKQGSLQKATAVFSDSAATAAHSDSADKVADHSVTSAAFDVSGQLALLPKGLVLGGDSLILEGIWIGYHEWYEDSNAEDGLDTNFVACPVVDDTTNTAIFPGFPYMPWYSTNVEAEGSVAALKIRTRMHTFVCQMDPGSGFWLRCPYYDATAYDVCGEWYAVVRYRTTPP